MKHFTTEMYLLSVFNPLSNIFLNLHSCNFHKIKQSIILNILHLKPELGNNKPTKSALKIVAGLEFMKRQAYKLCKPFVIFYRLAS
jgi:hypothetical protein